MLKINNLVSGYGSMNIIHGVDLTVAKGEIVCLLGANGAGKTTLLRAISGLLPIKQGSAYFNEHNLVGMPPEKIVKLGLSHVPQGRELFDNLTIAQNLRLGAFGMRLNAEELNKTKSLINEIFPVLATKEDYLSSSLSGGEQQMVALARALMAGPNLLLLDEPSLGLAPIITERIFSVIEQLRDLGMSILIVEQNAVSVLKIADRGYILDHGQIVATGDAATLLQDDVIRKNYLGY